MLNKKNNLPLLINKKNFFDAQHVIHQYKLEHCLMTRKSIRSNHRIKSLNFAQQTNKHLQFVQEQPNKNQNNTPASPLKKLVIRLEKLPDSVSQWKITNNTSLSFPPETKSISKKTHSARNSTSPDSIKRKRALFTSFTSDDEISYQKTKRLKKDSPASQLGSLWILERGKILDQFKQLSIDINLAHLSNNKKSFDECKAIAHNNYALFLIEDLNSTEKKYSDTKKIAFLKKAEQLLEKSMIFYKKTNLCEKKETLEACINSIRSSRLNLETRMDQVALLKESSSAKTQHPPAKPTMTFSKEKFREYQPILSNRLAYKFFNASLSEGTLPTIRKISLI